LKRGGKRTKRDEPVVRGLATLDPAMRALLDLSVRSDMDDEELAALTGREPWELVLDRAHAISDVAATCGLAGAEALPQTVAALEKLSAAAWARAEEPPATGDTDTAREERAARPREEQSELECALADLERLTRERDELAERVSIEADARERAEQLASHQVEMCAAAQEELAAERSRGEEAEERAEHEMTRRGRAEQEVAALRAAIGAAEARCAVAEEAAARLADGDREVPAGRPKRKPRLKLVADQAASANGTARPTAAEIAARARAAHQRAQAVSLFG
jgi:hypothetical protein